MTEQNGETKNQASMILGVIGGFLGIPTAICGGACASMCTSPDTGSATTIVQQTNGTVISVVTNLASSISPAAINTGSVFLYLGLLGSILAIVFGFLVNRNPTLSGTMLLISAVLVGMTLFVGNLLAILVIICLILAGALSFPPQKPAGN